MQTMKEWQQLLHAAFSARRPRNVRFQMFTDFTTRNVGIWREGGNVPADCIVEVTVNEQWFGFESVVVGDVDEASAAKVVDDLFAKFDKPHKKGK